MNVGNVVIAGGTSRENVMAGDRITMTTRSLSVFIDFAVAHSIPYASLRADKILNKLIQLKEDRLVYPSFRRNLSDIR